ncbi:MAG: GntR family transcriptional regulator [Ferrimicrobium sp.]
MDVDRSAGVRIVDPSSPVPLWVQVASILRVGIEQGEFSRRFPTQTELQERFGVSLATVRESIRYLREEGYLEAHQGRGTFVIARDRFESVRSQRFSLADRLAEDGLKEVNAVLAVEVVDSPSLVGRMRLAPETKLVRVERLRGGEGFPIAMEQSYIPLPVGRALLETDLTHGSLYEVLERDAHTVITAGRDEVGAIAASEREAVLLEVSPGTPLLSIERLATSSGVPIEFRRTLLVPDRVRFVSTWGAPGELPGRIHGTE